MDQLRRTLLDRASYTREAAEAHSGDSMYLLGMAHGLEEAADLYLKLRVEEDAAR